MEAYIVLKGMTLLIKKVYKNTINNLYLFEAAMGEILENHEYGNRGDGH